MANEKKLICPHSQSICIEGGTGVLVDGKVETHACPFWVRVVGKDPQGGADVDMWNCATAWMPILLIENSRIQYQTGAAVEDFRNRMMSAGASASQLFPAITQQTAPKELN